jgi:hypothetical protein
MGEAFAFLVRRQKNNLGVHVIHGKAAISGRGKSYKLFNASEDFLNRIK